MKIIDWLSDNIVNILMGIGIFLFLCFCVLMGYKLGIILTWIK